MFFEPLSAARLRRLAGSAMVAGAFALALAPAGVAQEAAQEGTGQAAASAPEAGQASQLGTWIKICAEDESSGEAKQACLVTQEVRTETGDFLSSVSVRQTEGEDGKMLMIAVPPGTLLQPGFRAQVDEGEQKPGKYVICLPNACYGEMEITDAFIDEMKRGENLIISVINNQGKAVGIGLTLMGFTKGWEGAPVDTELLAQERRRLQEQLQKRAADARERLQQQQAQQPAAAGEQSGSQAQ